MGCPTECVIGDNLVFSICTHDPDTGVLTDADAAPVWRLYEDETGTPLFTGTMTKLDDANTAGFYTELVACTLGNGFEVGKSYTVYIEATVDADRGGISFVFKMIAAYGGGGSYTATITVQNSVGAAAIQDVDVQIWNTALDSLVAYGITDSNGQVQIVLNDGSYRVKLRKGGWAFDIETLAMSGNTTVTYTGTGTSPLAPVAPDVCRVYEYCFMPDGTTPVSSVDAKARIVSLPEDTGSLLLTGQTIEGVYSSSTGLVYWDVPQGAKVQFTIQDFGIHQTETIPASATVRLSDI